MEKTKEGFKLVVKRWQNKQLNLFEQENYSYYCIATSDEEKSPHDILVFHNQRGQSENFHKELKLGFSMEYTPSQSLLGNAVYFELGVLAYNLTCAVKLLVLKEDWVTKTIATLRWQFLLMAGKVVKHGRTLFLKVRVLKKYHHKDTKSRRITKGINFASGKKSCPFVSWHLGGRFYSFSAVSKCVRTIFTCSPISG